MPRLLQTGIANTVMVVEELAPQLLTLQVLFSELDELLRGFRVFVV